MRNQYNFTVEYKYHEPLKLEAVDMGSGTKEAKEFIDSIKTDEGFYMPSVYNQYGQYVGDIDNLKQLLDKGIIPELKPSSLAKVNSGDKHPYTCSIGKSIKDGKWYGWSHRAIYGFEIGDKVKEGDCTASSGWTEEYIKDHPEEDLSLPVGFEAKTEEDCKRMAIAFADSVS